MKNLSFIILLFITSILHSQQVAIGVDHILKICSDRTVQSSGSNSFGQLGLANNTDTNVPLTISSLSNVEKVFAGGMHSFAVKTDGTVWAWGKNEEGQLGIGNNTTQNTPVQIIGLTNVKKIACGIMHSVCLKNDGTVWAWGDNGYGQVGNGTNNSSNTPTHINGLSNIVDIASMGYHVVALQSNGTVWSWGANLYGQLGSGNFENVNTPIQIAGLDSNIVKIEVGKFCSYALKSDHSLLAWGNNSYNQLTLSNENYSSPTLITAITNIQNLSSGSSHVLAQKTDGTFWVWGNGTNGQLLNDAYPMAQNIPLEVSFDYPVSSFQSAWLNSVTLKPDGTLMGWGINVSGQLGNGSNDDIASATQMQGCAVVLSNETTKIDDLTIYPNPVQQVLYVASEQLRGAHIQLYNNLGQVIKTVDTIDGFEVSINLVDVPAGLYWLEMEKNTVKVYSKIMKD